jgi:DNA-binding transcriptional regulator YiaG
MHDETQPKTRPRPRPESARVPPRSEPATPDHPLKTYDATILIGLKTIVHNAAVVRTDEKGETTVELPKMQELMAAAAVSRCLMPIKLRGAEIKSIRRIMGKTMAEFAKSLDEHTAAETIARWESDAQPMGGYAEKVLRLVVCEELSKSAPGMSYHASMIAALRVLDPWRVKKDYESPPICLEWGRIKETSGEVIDAYNARRKAA